MTKEDINPSREKRFIESVTCICARPFAHPGELQQRRRYPWRRVASQTWEQQEDMMILRLAASRWLTTHPVGVRFPGGETL